MHGHRRSISRRNLRRSLRRSVRRAWPRHPASTGYALYADARPSADGRLSL